jgi:hypothetical protein
MKEHGAGAAQRSGWARKLFVLLGLLVAVGVGGYLFSQRGGFRWQDFLATFTQIHGGWFAVANLFILATYVGRVIRWQVLIRHDRPHAAFGPMLSATLIGFTAVVFFGRAGEPVRPILIAQREGLPIASQLAVWVLERIYDLLMVLLVFGAALATFDLSSARHLGPQLTWVFRAGGHAAGVMATLCLGMLVAISLFSGPVRRRLLEATSFLPERVQQRVSSMLDSFIQGAQSTRNLSQLLAVVVLTVVEWTLILAAFYCLFRAFPVTSHLGWSEVMVVLGFGAFGSVVQIPGVGGGMQVVTALVLSEIFGLPLEQATGVALLVWLVSFVTVVPFGVAAALRDGLHWGQLKQTAHVAEGPVER